VIVVLLNAFDEGGGAARAASRLRRGLLEAGVDCRMLVQSKRSDAANVIGPKTPSEIIFSRLRPHLDALPVRFYPNRPILNFSPAMVPDNLTGRVARFKPDIIHLHWMGAGFFRLENLKRFNKPVVWTLHDSWAFTGGCFVPFPCTRYIQTCGECPVLGSKRERDLSRRVLERKKKNWQGSNLTVVTPSHWLGECAKSSSLFRHIRIEVIPNGLDLNRYKPVNKQAARDLMSLPQDKKLLLFAGMRSTSDRNKGFHLLVPALKALAEGGWKEKVELLIIGASKPTDMQEIGLPTRFLGLVHDEASIALLYGAADALIVPSMQENLPYSIMEAMACGTPCVGFDTGGISDLILHKQTGYLARPFEIEDLAKGIAWVLDDEVRHRMMSHHCCSKVENEFSLPKVAAQYASLYREILEGIHGPEKETKIPCNENDDRERTCHRKGPCPGC
jgi:glycosyltransferase involved in cell wall biosynthesis